MAVLREPRLSDNLYKLVVVGDNEVGKSSLVSRFCTNFYREVYSPTVGIDYKTKTFMFADKRLVAVELFDTAGLAKFRPLTSAYYHSASGIVLVYDVTNRTSFESLQKYLDELKFYTSPDTEVMIVGNKADESDKRTVTYEEADSFTSKSGLSLYETSAQTGSNVHEMFAELMTRIREKQELGHISVDSFQKGENNGEKTGNWCTFCCCV